MSKKQTGLRVDRVLYERFQELCETEKLRPGEAAEALIRLAVDVGSVGEVYEKAAKPGRTSQAVDDVLFASRLTRLKATLEYEKTLVDSREVLSDDDRMSDVLIEELVDIGRRSVSEDLIKRFQETITEADRLYEKSEKHSAESLIDERKRIDKILNPETTPRNGLPSVEES